MEINLTQFGGIADGKFDNTNAFKQAIQYCKTTGFKLRLPNGVIRITEPVIVGVKTFADKDAHNNSLYKDVPANNLVEYTKMRMCLPFDIEGGSRTIIYADFDATEPTAIFHIACKGDKRNILSPEQENMNVSNFTICTRGYIDNTTGQPNKILNALPTNNLIGIVAAFNYGMKIKDVTYLGLNEGLVMNNCYFSSVKRNHFRWCNNAMDSVYCETSKYENNRTYYCRTGINMRSSNCTIDTFCSEYCGQALIVNANNLTATSCYLESTKQYAIGAQLTIGQNPGEAGYNAINQVTGTIFNGLTVTIAGVEDKALGIEFKETARSVQFMSGSGQSIGLISYVNSLTRAIVYDFKSNNFPTAILKKMI